MSKNKFLIFLVAILALAIFLRFFRLGSAPGSMYWDEAAILLDSWSIAQTGLDWHGNHWLQPIFISYGDFKLPVYIWFASIAVKIFGPSAWAVRLASALTGVLSVILSALLVKDLWLLLKSKTLKNLKTETQNQIRLLQLAALLVAATAYFGIHFSRVAFEAHLGQLFLSLSIWGIVKILLKDNFVSTKKRLKKYNFFWLLFSLISAGLAVLTYYSVRFVLPLVVLSLVMSYGWVNRHHLKPRQVLNKVLMVVLIPFLVLGLSSLVFSKSPFFAESQQIRLSTQSLLSSTSHIKTANYIQAFYQRNLLSRILYHRESFRISSLLTNMATHFSPDFLYLTGDSNLRHGTGEHGLLSLLLLPILLVGIYQTAKKSKPLLFFLFAWYLAGVLPASVPLIVPHALRSLNAFQPIVILHALGLYFVWHEIDRCHFQFCQKRPLFKFATQFSLALALVVSSLLFFYHYLTQYQVDSRQAWQSGYQQVAKFVTANHSLYRRVWVNFPDQRWFLWLLLAQDNSPNQLSDLVRDRYGIASLANIQLHFPPCKQIQLANDLLVGSQTSVKAKVAECNFQSVKEHSLAAPTLEPILAVSKKL